MATRKKTTIVVWDWIMKNQDRIKWKQICREAGAGYSAFNNAIRYENELNMIDLKKISKVLLKMKISMETKEVW